MKAIIAILAAALFCGITFNTFAADIAKGKAVHDSKCMGCHDTHQYTRPNRIIHTLEDLHARVEFCDSASSAGFTPDDIDNVVDYLNTTFYKFK